MRSAVFVFLFSLFMLASPLASAAEPASPSKQTVAPVQISATPNLVCESHRMPDATKGSLGLNCDEVCATKGAACVGLVSRLVAGDCTSRTGGDGFCRCCTITNKQKN